MSETNHTYLTQLYDWRAARSGDSITISGNEPQGFAAARFRKIANVVLITPCPTGGSGAEAILKDGSRAWLRHRAANNPARF